MVNSEKCAMKDELCKNMWKEKIVCNCEENEKFGNIALIALK
jgi:hypothetical protein